MNFLMVNSTKEYNINVGLIISKYMYFYLILSNYFLNVQHIILKTNTYQLEIIYCM